ncbi:hypothetical protein ACOMHN_029846 [Nucella lapillus]
MRPLIIALALAIDHEEEQERKRRKRRRQLRRLRALQERARRARVWVRPWRTEAPRDSLGEFQQLLTSLELSDRAAFMNYTQMTPELFQEILQRIEPDITRQDTNYRRALQPCLKLAATLRHMATGASYINLSYSFRCGVSTISKFVPEVYSAILEAYKDEAFVAQCDPAFWVGVASQFSFGILANRFRCFLGTMVQKPENVRVIIKAAATIHNIMRQRASTPGEGDSTDGDGGQSTAGSWRDNVAWPDVHRGDGQRVGRGAHLQREYLKEYLSSPRGAVHWQWQKAGVPEPAEGQ